MQLPTSVMFFRKCTFRALNNINSLLNISYVSTETETILSFLKINCSIMFYLFYLFSLFYVGSYWWWGDIRDSWWCGKSCNWRMPRDQHSEWISKPSQKSGQPNSRPMYLYILCIKRWGSYLWWLYLISWQQQRERKNCVNSCNTLCLQHPRAVHALCLDQCLFSD